MTKLKLIKPGAFRFFKTIYSPESYYIVGSSDEIDYDDDKIIKKYLDQPENGTWVTLDNEELRYTAEKNIDFDFIQLQMNYAASLSKRDILTCSSYSFKGDRLINYYKRNEFNFDMFKGIRCASNVHSRNNLFSFCNIHVIQS